MGPMNNHSDDLISHFLTICQIPHGSGNTKALSAYLCRFAEDLHLPYQTDAVGNVLITKEGQGDGIGRAPVLLQGHIDMVCVKDPDVEHDFTKDPLDVVEEDGYLYAKGTSLGGDDGVAVAMMMSLLSDQDLSHPPMEALFTVEEETGMDGAAALDPTWIHARRMINLDSDKEGEFTCGCAGGEDVVFHIPVKRTPHNGQVVAISCGGLCGGHSAMIQEPHASANRLMARILMDLLHEEDSLLISISGGEQRNALATKATARLSVSPKLVSHLPDMMKDYEQAFRREYAGTDDQITVTMEIMQDADMDPCDRESGLRVAGMLLAVPHGVEKMSAIVDGLPETSANLGIVCTETDHVSGMMLCRSAVRSALDALCKRIVYMSQLFGGSAERGAPYPAWEFHKDSPMLQMMADVYRDMYGKEPAITVTHGGLECGILSDKIPDMDIVSIGPDLTDIHSSKEKLNVASFLRVYAFVKEVLSVMA